MNTIKTILECDGCRCRIWVGDKYYVAEGLHFCVACMGPYAGRGAGG